MSHESIREPSGVQKRVVVEHSHPLSGTDSREAIHDHSEDEVDEPGRDSNENILDEFPDDIEEIDLRHERLKTLEGIGFERFTRLKQLGLRQNLISKIEGLNGLTTLNDLDLYDNRITCIENVENLTGLT
ncbi:hypothetical protein BDK51DRAFT_47908 [Blyttiomyces helicus]|uniref:Protein phosphatase 1 regulatory subunit 7 n=1 Tax=Blyttiomyces helicus TaxID=388810 RepID=A0A4P9WKQ6_9FUNG|nr:hypothetical protein BDK51DRAFT_47908 [Blyttiomyces helicus]|eukprot:RKO92982.1 hypothetical protein BDK51DRAFT_47908 [Blyttiomyces helicus]